MQENGTSNLLLAEIFLIHGEPSARIRFREWDAAPIAYGGPNGEGIPLFKTLPPEGSTPELVSFTADDWKNKNNTSAANDYKAVLRKIAGATPQFGLAQTVRFFSHLLQDCVSSSPPSPSHSYFRCA